MTELKLALQGLRTGKWELVRGETSTPPPLPSLPSRPAAPPPPPPRVRAAGGRGFRLPQEG